MCTCTFALHPLKFLWHFSNNLCNCHHFSSCREILIWWLLFDLQDHYLSIKSADRISFKCLESLKLLFPSSCAANRRGENVTRQDVCAGQTSFVLAAGHVGIQGSWRRDAQPSLAVIPAGLAFCLLLKCIHHRTMEWFRLERTSGSSCSHVAGMPPTGSGCSGPHLHPHSAPWIYPVGFRLWLCPCCLSQKLNSDLFSGQRKSVNFSVELD